MIVHIVCIYSQADILSEDWGVSLGHPLERIMELIKLNEQNINNQIIKTVNARELHEFLGSKQEFSTWIRSRVEKYEFIEDQDFLIILSKIPQKGRPSKEYYISLDMAKELAMVENNEKGREARRYFIQCEKELREISTKQRCFLEIIEATDQEQILLGLNKLNTKVIVPLENKVKEQAAALEEVKPKVTYHDMVLDNTELLSISQIAQDYPISNQRLNRILAEKGIQYKDRSGMWCLYAKYSRQGYAQTSTHVCQGGSCVKLHLKWTQKGRLFIYELLKEDGILPNCEVL